MKLRNWVLAYTLLMLGMLLLLLEILSESRFQSRDMIFYNKQQKEIEGLLKDSGDNEERMFEENYDRAAIEKQFQCSLLFLDDQDYQQRLNELQKDRAVILDLSRDGRIFGKIAWREEKEVFLGQRRALRQSLLLLWASLLWVGWLLLLFVYVWMIRPFRRLQKFSLQIAKGNLDFPLPIQKHNFFGAYTESFDLMREELKRAREGEYQANLSKKELVAQLSHDIKTPIATIQATCEVLSLRPQEADTRKKLAVIGAKANTVSRLVDNMFHATLEELTVLKVEPGAVNALEIQEMFRNYEGCGEIQCQNEIASCLLLADKIRLEQAMDNIINNSYKYAGTKITVSFGEEPKGVRIRIRDEGPGVSEEELAMITEKFYRGSNAKGKAGSGLGLYLSRLFLEQMGGGLECSLQNGFVVELFLKKV